LHEDESRSLASLGIDVKMRLRLPLPANFHFDAIVRSHGWYDLPPFAYDARRSI